MKTFIACSVHLNKVLDKYRGNNNNCQYTILCRAKSKKEVARILAKANGYREPDDFDINRTYNTLRNFNGIHETDLEKHVNVIKKDNTIYFNPGATKSGYYDIWLEYNEENQRPVIKNES